MGTETFQKRQKENARKEKHKLKLARRLERKNEKVPGENSLDVDILELERAAEKSGDQSSGQPGPTN